MSTRTDPHRPGAIMPDDYRYVLSFGTMPPPAPGMPPVRYNVEKALEMQKAEPFFPSNRGIFQCDVCGAHYNHGDVWLHIPTGEHITIGHDCADKYSMFAGRSEWQAWHKEQTRLRSLAAKEKKFKLAAHKFLEERPELKAALELGRIWTEEDHEEFYTRDSEGLITNTYMPKDAAQRRYRETTLADMRSKLNQYGSMSDNAVRFALKLADELRAAELAAANPAPPPEEERHVAAPTGRQTVRGKVVSVKTYDGAWGSSLKMVVKVETPEGSWLVWTTVPRAIEDELGENRVLRGQMVEFTATLQPGRDDHFAFGKRPTGGRIIENQEEVA